MISKSDELSRVDSFSKGGGLPFDLPTRGELEKNDAERQKPIVIDLNDLNGQDGGKGMPKNFVRKAGRQLATFSKYWTSDENPTGTDIQ